MVDSNDFIRLLQREARKEYQLILGRCNEFGFEYVIKRPPQARICFGNGVPREAVPLHGPAMSSLMRRILAQPLGVNLAPGRYNISYSAPEDHPVVRKRFSKTGYGTLAATTVRFHLEEVNNSTTGGGEYNAMKKRTARSVAKPFGSGTERMKCSVSTVPGVGTYVFKTRKDIRNHSFGGTIKIVPAARTICKPENFDKCSRCDRKPEVDYWKHLRTERCLCRRCMTAELSDARYCSKTKSEVQKRTETLKEYKRIRHCSYYHRHDKTSAACQFVSNKQLKRKFLLENYLSMFE